MKQDEFTVLQGDIRWAAMNKGRLSEKESEFVDDLLDQVVVYGRHMIFTPRQGDWLKRIMEKLDEARND